MIIFSTTEKKFLKALEECRIATVHDKIPHVKPVSYIFDNDSILIATDYETWTYKNLKQNPKSALSIDIYKSGAHQAICIQGDTEIIGNGPQFLEIYDMFFDKFEWVRNEPWKENEAPFLKIIPFSKTSWGLS